MKHKQSKSNALLELRRDEIARCVKCGSCSAVCPSYLFSRVESFSPRGRMALIKSVLEGRLAISKRYQSRLASCTGCLACEASCVTGVRVTEIIQAAKEQAADEAGTGAAGAVIAAALRRPALFHLASRFAPIALHYPGRSIRGGVSSSRFGVRRSEKIGAKQTEKRGSRGTVVFFPGCAVSHFQPDIGSSVKNVLNMLGYDVVVPNELKCCGRPLLSLGDRAGARELAAHNSGILAELEADAIVTACASCGLTFKSEYPKLLPHNAKRPAVLDIHEFLAQNLDNITLGTIRRNITVHDPCHLGRGQGLSQTVRDLLTRIPGVTLREMRDSDRCCGFGGVMRVTHRELSDGIAEAKGKNIIATNAEICVTGCPGCRMQIADALLHAESDVEVLHPVQILEEALKTEE